MQANQYNTPAKKIKSKSSELETVSELQVKTYGKYGSSKQIENFMVKNTEVVSAS